MLIIIVQGDSERPVGLACELLPVVEMLCIIDKFQACAMIS